MCKLNFIYGLLITHLSIAHKDEKNKHSKLKALHDNNSAISKGLKLCLEMLDKDMEHPVLAFRVDLEARGAEDLRRKVAMKKAP